MCRSACRSLTKILAFAKGSTFTEVSLEALRKITLAAPPLPEQQKIAEILSVWDKAIETTEALLANARTQKRALMQALLSGTRRFPGFEGHGWEAGTLSTIADIHMGQSPAGETYNADGVGAPLINGPTEFTDRHPVTRQWTTQPTKMCAKLATFWFVCAEAQPVE